MAILEGAAAISGIASASGAGVLIVVGAASITGVATATATGVGGFSLIEMDPPHESVNVYYRAVEMLVEHGTDMDPDLINLKVNAISATLANGLLEVEGLGDLSTLRAISSADWWDGSFDLVPVTFTYDSVDILTRNFTTGEQPNEPVRAVGSYAALPVQSERYTSSDGSWIAILQVVAADAAGNFVVSTLPVTRADGHYWVAGEVVKDFTGFGIVGIYEIVDHDGSGLPFGDTLQDNDGSGLPQGWFVKDLDGQGLPSIEAIQDFIGEGLPANIEIIDFTGEGIPAGANGRARIEIQLIDKEGESILRDHGVTFEPIADIRGAASITGVATATATGLVV